MANTQRRQEKKTHRNHIFVFMAIVSSRSFHLSKVKDLFDDGDVRAFSILVDDSSESFDKIQIKMYR